MKIIRRILLLLIVLCVLAALLALGVSSYVVLSERGRIRTAEEDPEGKLDCILVLGCGLEADGTPKPMLTDRLRVAVTLYQRGWADTLIFSGDDSGPYHNEPGSMKTWALAQGVPESAILLDGEGFNTAASIRRAGRVFGMKRVAVVTQRYHLYRALYLAGHMDLDAVGVSSALRSYGPKQAIWSGREILARDKDVLYTLLGKYKGGNPA